MTDLCRECEIRIQWGYFEEGFSDEVKRRFGDEHIEWSFQELYSDTVEVMNVDARLNGEGYPPDCSTLLARCLEIVRREEHRPERIRLWELEQKRKRLE